MDWPGPTESSVICGGPLCDTEIAHFPSGDRVSAVPSARRMGGEPSILRIATAPFGAVGSELSSKSTDCPSGEISFAILQSYQERSCAGLSFSLHSMASRSLSMVARMRPSGATSCMVKPPGTLSSRRCFPDKVTAQMDRLLAPFSKAVNHTSFTFGDHAKPYSHSQSDESFVVCPDMSVT